MLGEIHLLVQDNIFRENSPVTLKMGSRPPKPNQGFVLSNRYTFASLEKNPSTVSSSNIILRTIAYDLENRVKVTKTKPIIHPLPTIIKCYIFANFVIIHPFLQEICYKSFFNIFLSSCDLENRVKVTKIYSFFSISKCKHTYVWPQSLLSEDRMKTRSL